MRSFCGPDGVGIGRDGVVEGDGGGGDDGERCGKVVGGDQDVGQAEMPP